MSSIRLDGVSFFHRDIWGRRTSEGVRCLDFTVRQGKILTLTGPNGSGKSTVIRLCMGFIMPVSGRILRPRGALLSYIGDAGRSLYPDLSLEGNIEYLLAIRGIGYRAGIGRAAKRLGSFLGLEEKGMPVSSMSRGMRQKAAIICALLMPHEFLFADEPTLGLDSGSQKEFECMMCEEAERGRGVCVATNDIGMAGRISDESLTIVKGCPAGRAA